MRANAPFEPDRGPSRSASAMPGKGSSSYYSGPFGWWFRLSVPPEPPASADFATRDRARRGRLGGSLLFGLLAITILTVFIGLGDPATLISALIGVGAVVLAIILNRSGFVNIAGLIMVAIPALVIILSIVGAPNGQLDALYFPLFDLLVISEVVAASLLTPAAVVIVMLAIMGFTVADILLQPHVAAMNDLFATSDGLLTLLARPVAFQLIVGVIGFLWARNTVQSIRRADRAEELAELERRELERTHELEEGVRQLLAVHVHLANGDFNVRAPAIRNSLLWQIGSSLNNLVARLGRLAQAEFVLRRTQEEANRVTEAIYMINSGRQPIWPGPSNTPLDRLVDVLRTSLTPRGAAGGGGGGGVIPGGPQAPQLPSSATGAYPGAPGMGMNQPPSIAPGMPMPGMAGMPGGMMGAIPDRPPSPTGYPGSAPVPNSLQNPNNPNTPNTPGAPNGAHPNNPVPDWMRPLMPADGSGGSGGSGQPQRPPMDGSRSPISGPGSGPASGFGAPVAPGYGAPAQQPQPQSPQSDVNPWSLEPGEPLDDSDLPEWLRQPNQE